MSTDFPDDSQSASEWISQAEAARIHGVSRQAINKLVRAGRLRTLSIGGHILVHHDEIAQFQPKAAGRPAADESRDYDRIKALLDSCSQPTRDRIYTELRARQRPHPIEARLGADADVILEALNRAGELTTRMFRGVIAEAAFDIHVVHSLPDWQSEPVVGNPPYDFRLSDRSGSVRVQVKLQRSQHGRPIVRSGYSIVETRRTRGGIKKGEAGNAEKTRPYRYGEFDIIAVCLQPASGRWDDFRYTVGNWLQHRNENPDLIATYQPVPMEPNDDWTDRLTTCIEWFRSGAASRIGGTLGGRRNREGP